MPDLVIWIASTAYTHSFAGPVPSYMNVGGHSFACSGRKATIVKLLSSRVAYHFGDVPEEFVKDNAILDAGVCGFPAFSFHISTSVEFDAGNNVGPFPPAVDFKHEYDLSQVVWCKSPPEIGRLDEEGKFVP